MAKFLFTMLPANDLGLPTRLVPIARALADRGHHRRNPQHRGWGWASRFPELRPIAPTESSDKCFRIWRERGFEPPTPRVPNHEITNSKCFIWCRLGSGPPLFLSLSCTDLVPKGGNPRLLVDTGGCH